jgi:catechol 2,3-dioxygenase-like lactoylglutathione lyase family enzyme
VEIQFIAGVAVVAADPELSRALYVDALGLQLEGSAGSDYFHSGHIGGSKHFGVWPLRDAAKACFGRDEWPADRPVPQVSIEFEIEDRRRRDGGGRARGARIRAAARRA